LGVFVADVSGHGVAASLLSFSLTHWFDQNLGSGAGRIERAGLDASSPASVAESLNRYFPIDLTTGQYFTIVYGVLDIGSREFRYVCAGHPPPVWAPLSGAAKATPTSSFPIGISDEPAYTESVIQLSAGDRVFLYSDGLVEAENLNHVEFGLERVFKCLSSNPAATLDSAVNGLLGSVGDWSGRSGFDDDISVLGIEIE
jgi:sigma-B regulation protein RsbU (phosphoserine phosphatase)